MSRRNRRPSNADTIYSDFLYGKMFQNNPANNRESLIQRQLMRSMTEIAVNRFKWTGLPETVNPRFLETTLFYNGLAIYFDHPNFGEIVTKGSAAGNLNFENDPTAFLTVGSNYTSRRVEAKDAVPIWTNYLRIPDIDIVLNYAPKLAQLDRTIEINSLNARQSKVLTSNENQKLSIVNINRQIDEGVNGIQVAGPLQDMSFVQALDLGVEPLSHEKLHILRTRLWNEFAGYLGIDNANQDKKERLVAAEVDANQEIIKSIKRANLNARQEAAEQISKKFNRTVTVDYWTEFLEQEDEKRQAELDNNDGGENEE